MSEMPPLTSSSSEVYPGYVVRILEMLAQIRTNQDNMLGCIEGMTGRVARMEGRAQDLGMNVGSLCLRIESLGKGVEAHDRKIEQQEREIRELTDAVQQARGSWRALMVVAGIAAFLSSLVTYLGRLFLDLVNLSKGTK